MYRPLGAPAPSVRIMNEEEVKTTIAGLIAKLETATATIATLQGENDVLRAQRQECVETVAALVDRGEAMKRCSSSRFFVTRAPAAKPANSSPRTTSGK